MYVISNIRTCYTEHSISQNFLVSCFRPTRPAIVDLSAFPVMWSLEARVQKAKNALDAVIENPDATEVDFEIALAQANALEPLPDWKTSMQIVCMLHKLNTEYCWN